jgi:hypothetical protein
MLSKINPLYFCLSFAIGILLVYITTPPPDIVLKFPSPYNAGKVKYIDKAQNCYKYRAEHVECSNNFSKVKPQPILEDFQREMYKTNLAKT